MTSKQRLNKFRTECSDWDQIIGNLGGNYGMSKRQVEKSILELIDSGLVHIEPNAGGPTAFVLTIPDGIPDEVLTHVEK